jgi:hypothetical protein
MFDQVLAGLDEVIELDVPADGGAITAFFARIDRQLALAAGAVGQFAADGGPQREGAVTLTSWLMHRLGLTRTAAAQLAARATKLGRLPVLRAAYESGSVGTGAVDAILAHVPNRHLDRFAQHEAELVPALVGLDRRDLSAAMGTWLARADALDPGPAPPERPDTVYFSPTGGNRAIVQGNLGADTASVVAAALRAADSGDINTPVPQRQAQSLGQICQEFLDHRTEPPSASRHRPHVNVVMTLEQWAAQAGAPPARDLDTDLPLSPAATGALRCDAIVHPLVHDADGVVLHYGRGTRVWPRSLVNAIIVRDQGCRWPGCTAPARWCDVHHALAWERGGTTSIDNGLLLCRRHHHLLHRRLGWHLKLHHDSTAVLTHPTGNTETSRPRGLSP